MGKYFRTNYNNNAFIILVIIIHFMSMICNFPNNWYIYGKG